jgi:hypothetical protein
MDGDYSSIGLTGIKVNDFSAVLKNMGRLYIKSLGVKGILKMIWYLLKSKSLRKGFVEYNKFFKEHRTYIGYGYFIGRKN